jgi:4-amino-4-deoxy-L-arabinose transferase-like glycosyltransferase
MQTSEIRRKYGFTITALASLALAWSYFYTRGIDFGRPFVQPFDERPTVRNALKVLRKGDFNTNNDGYPPLQTYLLAGLMELKYISNNSAGRYRASYMNPDSPPIFKPIDRLTPREVFDFYVVGRLSSAVFAGGAIFLVFVTASEFYSAWAAVLAALALLLLPTHVEQAHYALPNTLNGMLATAAAYMSIRFVKTQDLRFLYVAFVVAGLAVSNKFNVTVAAAPALALGLGFNRRIAWHVPLLIASFALTIVASFPYAFVEPATFAQRLAWTLWSYNFEDVWVRAAHPYYACAYWLRDQGQVFFWLSLLGVPGLFAFGWRSAAVFATAPLFYYYERCGSTYFAPQRDLIPILPFLAVGFGGALVVVDHTVRLFLKKRFIHAATGVRLLCVGTIAVLALQPLGAASRAVLRQFTASDVLQITQQWIEANIPEGSSFYCERLMEPVPVPLPDEGYQVRNDTGKYEYGQFYFEDPYCAYTDVDYLVAAYTGKYDSIPGLRLFRHRRLMKGVPLQGDSLLADYLAKNRRLFEARIEPVFVASNSAYQKVAEWGIGWPTVTVYRMPDLLETDVDSARLWKGLIPPVNQEPDQGALENGLGIGGNTSIRLPLLVPAGTYDVFALLQGVYAMGEPAPKVSFRDKDGAASVVDVIFTYPKYYPVMTINSQEEKLSELSIAVTNSMHESHKVMIKKVAFFRKLGANSHTDQGAIEPDPKTLGPNIVLGGDFESAPAMAQSWTFSGILPPTAVGLDEKTRVFGKASLKLKLPASLDLIAAQQVVPGTAGKRFRLRGYIKTRNVEGQVRLEVQDAAGGHTPFLVATKASTGTSPWRYLSADFTVPEHVPAIRVMLRQLNIKTRKESQGTVWLDGVSLNEIL